VHGKLTVNPVDYRKQLEDIINDNGGEYRANLTKDVTHLIAKEPSGQKYKYATTWEIKTVAVEWVEQSLERGMILDEILYNLLLPVEERGRGAWLNRSMSSTSLGKHARDGAIAPQNVRKLRRTASAKLERHNDGLWTDIVAGEPNLVESKLDAWDDKPDELTDSENTLKGTGSITADTGCAKFVEKRLSLNRSQSMAAVESLLGKLPQKEALFEGKTFLILDFDDKKMPILESHLRSHGAHFVEKLDQLLSLDGTSFLLIPHTTIKSDALTMLEGRQEPELVTDLWIERCLYQKRFEPPSLNVTSTPFCRFPITGFANLKICSTAFQGIDLLHIYKVVKLMGGTYDEFFTHEASVLVCNKFNPGHEKLRHAQLWGVPAVSAAWLWDGIRNGELLPFETYLIQSIALPSQQALGPALTDQSSEARKPRYEISAATKTFTTDRSTKKPPTIAERNKRPKKDLPHFGRPSNTADNLFPDDAGPPTEVLLDEDTLLPPDTNSAVGSSNTVNTASTSAPLREITPNSSPPKPIPTQRHGTTTAPDNTAPKQSSLPEKDEGLAPTFSKEDEKAGNTNDTLGTTISSLLAHHQCSSSMNASKPASGPSKSGPHRRRRQLFGRAPSNLSSYSLDLSRASSVDTRNTDGVGTPIELSSTSIRHKTNDHNHNSNSNSNIEKEKQQPKAIYDHDDDPEGKEEPLQMTQLGYEDPDVAAWRERVAFKMAGGKVTGKVGTTPGRRGRPPGGGVGPGKNVTGSLGIAKRTRQAVG